MNIQENVEKNTATNLYIIFNNIIYFNQITLIKLGYRFK